METLETIGKGNCQECGDNEYLYNKKDSQICGSCCCLLKYNQ